MTKPTDEVGMLVFSKYVILDEETIEKVLKLPFSADSLMVLVLLRLNVSISDIEQKTGLHRSEIKQTIKLLADII